MTVLRSLLFLLLSPCLAAAGDWPQWLGPHRDGTTSETVSAWTTAPRILWRHRVGQGHSSPVVSGGRLYLFAKVPDQEAEELTAYDAQSGKRLWHTSYPRGKFSSLFGNGPQATPAIADGRVLTSGATGVLTCFDAKTGQKLWQVDTLAKFHTANLKFGVACSPLVIGKEVLVNVGAKGASVVALDVVNGKVRWQSQNDPASYASPIVTGTGKQEQGIFVTGRHVLSLDPQNGGVFWQYPMLDLLSESSSTPVVADGKVVVSSVTLGSTAYQLRSRAGKPSASVAWKNPSLSCYFSTPVVVGKDQLFMVTGRFLPPIEATLHCVDPKTGKSRWQERGVGRYHAALIRTGNNKLLMMEDRGVLVLLDPSAGRYHELARAKLCGQTWAHPALAGGRLYVRDEGELLCVDLGQ